MSREEPETSTFPSTEVFELLGNETRLAIIVELARHRRTAWRMDGLAFADLRKAVGVRDAGTFNYHLDRLQDRFVVERDDEYVLTNEGLAIADAIIAGRYGDRRTERRTDTEYACPDCDEGLTAVYERGTVALVCDDHGSVVATTLPPGAVENRPMEQVVSIAFQDMQQDIETALEGVCFHCWGRMHATIAVDRSLEHPATGEPIDADPDSLYDPPVAAFGCERCETVFWTAPAACVLRHPSVISFYHDHGIDVMRSAFVGRSPNGDGVETTVVSSDPVRVRIAFGLDSDRLALTFDGDATVVDVDEP